MHEFPLVYGFGIESDWKQPKKKDKLGIAIYHDKSMTKEQKEALIAKFESEAPAHGYPIYWLVSTPFQLDGLKDEAGPHYFHRSV